MRRLTFLLLVLVMAGSFMAPAQPFGVPSNKKVKIDETNLPIVWIEVDGNVNLYERITAHMKIIDNGQGQLNYGDTVAHPGQHIDYEGYIGLRYRGNTSYSLSNKPPFSFRPLDRPLEQGGTWKKVPLLGMPRDSKWALLAPYSDKSMIRDILAFEISRPWMDYTPRARFCEVIYNGMYYGVYLLTEVVSQGKYRLNLDDPGEEGDALTGGYLMEVDRNNEPHYRSRYHPVRNNGSVLGAYSVYCQYKFPDYEDLTATQMAYIQSQIDQMEYSLAHEFRDPATGECTYIDELSFIDFQLAMEIGHNVDAYRLSTKFYKRRDSVDPRFKLASWDMNLAYCNVDYNQGWRTDTWVYQSNDLMIQLGEVYLVPFWWYKLNKDETYVRLLKQRWAQYRRGNLRMDRIMGTIDSLVTVLIVGNAEYRNSRAYPMWSIYVWPNYHISDSFEEEIAFLKQWLVDRIQWMDQQLDFDPDAGIGDVNGDGEVNIADVNALIDLILSGVPITDSRADVNGDGEMNIADINALIDLILS